MFLERSCDNSAPSWRVRGHFLLGYAVIIKYIIFFCYDVSGSSTERATGATGSDRRSRLGDRQFPDNLLISRQDGILYNLFEKLL